MLTRRRARLSGSPIRFAAAAVLAATAALVPVPLPAEGQPEDLGRPDECVSMCDAQRSVFAGDFEELAAAGVIDSQRLLVGVHEPIPAAELAEWLRGFLVFFPDLDGPAVEILERLPARTLITRAQATALFAVLFAVGLSEPSEGDDSLAGLAPRVFEAPSDIDPEVHPGTAAAVAALAQAGIVMECDAAPGGLCGGEWLTRGQAARVLAGLADPDDYVIPETEPVSVTETDPTDPETDPVSITEPDPPTSPNPTPPTPNPTPPTSPNPTPPASPPTPPTQSLLRTRSQTRNSDRPRSRKPRNARPGILTGLRA